MKKFLSLILVAIMLLTMAPFVSAEGTVYKAGDIIKFGLYPQSKIEDKALTAELDALVPDISEWISYKYYSGDGNMGSMKPMYNFFRYTDVIYHGKKYRCVNFYCSRPSITYYGIQKYTYNKVFTWFLFEDIEWRVIDPDKGLVTSEFILDSQPFSNTIYHNGDINDDVRFINFNDAEFTNYASDYATSSIRQWLNDDFYNTAFSDVEKKKIATTTLNNDACYDEVGEEVYKKLNSVETKDKIFLLSYDEVKNYGIEIGSQTENRKNSLVADGSDYARKQGLSYRMFNDNTTGLSYTLLRSSGPTSYYCMTLDGLGFARTSLVYDTTKGIRPAFRFKDISHIGLHESVHSYRKTVTYPTCTEVGFTTYTCACGAEYTHDYTYKYHNFDGTICTECGYDGTTGCECTCHKSGIWDILWNIVEVIYKVFRIEGFCICGFEHEL